MITAYRSAGIHTHTDAIWSTTIIEDYYGSTTIIVVLCVSTTTIVSLAYAIGTLIVTYIYEFINQ